MPADNTGKRESASRNAGVGGKTAVREYPLCAAQ
jgi:hypothetical protein